MKVGFEMRDVKKLRVVGAASDMAEVISLLRKAWGRSTFKVVPSNGGDVIIHLIAPEQKEKTKWILNRYGFEVEEV